MAGFPRVCFIRNTTKNPNIVVGDYTYYDDPEHSEDFERNVLYHYPFIGDKLMPWRMAQAARLATFPWRVSALVWQEYWRTWHEVWRGPR